MEVILKGGGNGLGKQLAIQLAQRGARIVIWDIDKESAERTAMLIRSMRTDALSYQCDCSNEHEVKLLASQVKREVGPVEILINNAGILNGQSITMLNDNEIRRCIDVNLLAHFWTVRAFLPEMLEKNEGHIVTISSTAGLHGTPYLIDYCASKSGVNAFHETLSLELRDLGLNGIKLTCVCPHFFNTGMTWMPKTNVPWLLPILQTEDVAFRIAEAIQMDEVFIAIPDFMQNVISVSRSLPRRAYLALYDLLGIGIEPRVVSNKMSRDSLTGR